MKINNLKLYESIEKYYITGKKTQKQIADMNGITLGAVKNFLYNHKINKKSNYKKIYKEIKQKRKDGAVVNLLAKEYKKTQQEIYYILNK